MKYLDKKHTVNTLWLGVVLFIIAAVLAVAPLLPTAFGGGVHAEQQFVKASSDENEDGSLPNGSVKGELTREGDAREYYFDVPVSGTLEISFKHAVIQSQSSAAFWQIIVIDNHNTGDELKRIEALGKNAEDKGSLNVEPGSYIVIVLLERSIANNDGKYVLTVTFRCDEHEYGDEVEIEPTCTEQGGKVKTCAVCGNKDITDPVPALGHDLEWVTPATATCERAGQTYSRCKRCDTKSEITVLPQLEHKGKWITLQAATCTVPGLELFVCDECSNTLETKSSPLLEHNYKKEEKAATMVSDGITTYTCVDCGKSYSETETWLWWTWLIIGLGTPIVGFGLFFFIRAVKN